MIVLDASRLPPNMANLLLLRGADLPPFQWQVKPNQAAKEMLDRLAEDTDLFGRDSLVDDPMAAAVRALLYLWNGWLTECSMFAQAAPDKERLYLGSLCERHGGHPREAKDILRQIDRHAVFELMKAYAVEAIGLGTDPPLQRFKQIIELGEVWEPFAFIDLYEQSRAGKHCHPTEQTVRSLQCREFELLFAHCYEAATGETLAEEPAPSPALHRKPAAKVTRRPTPSSQVTEASPGPKMPRAPSLLHKSKGPRVGVMCPKCQQTMTLPESCRGSQGQCRKCGATFLVPQKNAAAKVAPPS